MRRKGDDGRPFLLCTMKKCAWNLFKDEMMCGLIRRFMRLLSKNKDAAQWTLRKRAMKGWIMVDETGMKGKKSLRLLDRIRFGITT